ncbi:MAG TPA: hypothetical protein VIY54_10280 [Steroidobacteraceae bacterium]
MRLRNGRAAAGSRKFQIQPQLADPGEDCADRLSGGALAAQTVLPLLPNCCWTERREFHFAVRRTRKGQLIERPITALTLHARPARLPP